MFTCILQHETCQQIGVHEFSDEVSVVSIMNLHLDNILCQHDAIPVHKALTNIGFAFSMQEKGASCSARVGVVSGTG